MPARENQPNRSAVTNLVLRWRSYNRVVVVTGFLALAGGIALWIGLYFFGKFAVLGVLSSIYGHEAEVPKGYGYWYAGACIVLVLLHFVLGELFIPPTAYDRPILGWHLVPQVMTLPVSLTFAAFEQWRRYVGVEQGLLVQMMEWMREVKARGRIWLDEWENIPLSERGRAMRALRLLEELGYVAVRVHRPAPGGVGEGREGRVYLALNEREKEEVERLMGEMAEWVGDSI